MKLYFYLQLLFPAHSLNYPFDPMDPSAVEFRAFYPYTPNEVKHRKRTTSAQLKVLESVSKRDTKPNAALRNELAVQLNMTARGVQVWFQNWRAKEKIKTSTTASADKGREAKKQEQKKKQQQLYVQGKDKTVSPSDHNQKADGYYHAPKTPCKRALLVGLRPGDRKKPSFKTVVMPWIEPYNYLPLSSERKEEDNTGCMPLRIIRGVRDGLFDDDAPREHLQQSELTTALLVPSRPYIQANPRDQSCRGQANRRDKANRRDLEEPSRIAILANVPISVRPTGSLNGSSSFFSNAHGFEATHPTFNNAQTINVTINNFNGHTILRPEDPTYRDLELKLAQTKEQLTQLKIENLQLRNTNLELRLSQLEQLRQRIPPEPPPPPDSLSRYLYTFLDTCNGT
ncbi:hypothetical protein D9758_015030 [Tetrapyrgos nigripes]|uniref:Homeobox domain-containing protein n=1 Tax=Tetrapyrgos nigripes TaxID=182062 RepID=A0A8H5CG50_9AGAR|nr:hypothetical protein D9758_015030 [Tetrapyrgos nigripes]